MPRLGTWLEAMRLRTLPLAFSSILMGSALAMHDGSHHMVVTLLALLTTLFLQILSNFANDYGDFSKGTDNEHRIGPQRTMQSGAITPSQMKAALIICASLSLLTGISLLIVAFSGSSFSWLFLLFFLLGLGAIAAALKYTIGKNPYGYQGMGDIFVFIFFGIVGVVGVYFLHTHSYNPAVIFPAITVGAFSAAVLNLNNMRDCENDEASGKYTLAVKLGVVGSKTYHYFLLILGTLSFLNYLYFFVNDKLLWLASIPLLVIIRNGFFVFKNTVPQQLDPELKRVALSTFLISLLFFIIQFIEA